MHITLTQIVLILWGLLLLAALLQYGGLLESLRALKGIGVKLVAGLVTVVAVAAVIYRSNGYMTPEREGWIVRGRTPADSVSPGFNTKARFRSLAQPLGRVTDRNGTLLAGYHFDEHLKRTYPAGSVTAHMVGYWTGPLRDGMGIEKALTMLNDSLHDDLPHDVKLALDLRLQRDAMRALGGRFGAIVVMDASNGEVLAAANYPTFDPDSVWYDEAWTRYVRDTLNRPLTSRAIKDNFSPGSSIKPFIAAAALQLGTPLPEQSGFVCTGTYTPVRGTSEITEHGSAHGRVDMARAMRYSCNVYFSYLAYGLVGFRPAKAYLDSIGFDERLRWNSAAFLNEYRTLLPARSWVKGRDEIAKSRLGIGQASVKSNPIHVAVLMAGIANGGIFHSPMLERGRVPDTLHWHMSPAIARKLDALLREPLLPGGTAAKAFAGIGSRGIEVFGKTGTADREPDGREPSWFISYGRKNGRTFAVVVAIQNRNGMFAGDLNAPMARRMYEALDGYGYYSERPGAHR
ncbi:MAG TPA: penicillin-binding transpeptidase domain-containing protein [Candidatus Kapabacteria bacterium]|nr:penicillin-binding transpeptidase domain-containing protein [Candidatus Kapabacteria bacterium]